MSLYVKNGTTMKVANKDIKVYKRLNIGRKGGLTSPYQGTPYYLNKMVTAKKDFAKSIMEHNFGDNSPLTYGLHAYTTKLTYGLHAYTTKQRAFTTVHWSYEGIFEAVIPKGARYIKGLYNEILTDQLMCIKQVKHRK